MEQEKIVVPAEELELEQKALAEVKEDEVRAEIIAEFGFDEVDDAEKIDKLVAKEIGHKKAITTAIGQKIKWRTKVNEKPPVETKTKVESPKEVDIDAKVSEVLDKRDLDSLEYPDDIKAEISRVQKIQGSNVKKALSDPYIKSRIEVYEREQRTNEATISRTKKQSGETVFDIDNPPEVDMGTPEGRKKWDDFLAFSIRKEMGK